MRVRGQLALCLAAIILPHTAAKPQTSNAIDYSEDRNNEEEKYKARLRSAGAYRAPSRHLRFVRMSALHIPSVVQSHEPPLRALPPHPTVRLPLCAR